MQGVAQAPNQQRPKRVLATDGTKEPLQGICIFFVRPNNSKPVSTANMVDVSASVLCTPIVFLLAGNALIFPPVCVVRFALQDLHCGVLDASRGRSVLQVIQEYMNIVMIPALTSGQAWGQLPSKKVSDFLSMLKCFSGFLKSKNDDA